MDLSFRLNIPRKGWEQGCALCWELLRDGDPETEIEYDDEALEGWRFRRVWHKACYDKYLETGKECG